MAIEIRGESVHPARLAANLRHGQPTANLAREIIWKLVVARHGFHLTRAWICPKRMGTALSFEYAPMFAKVLE